MATRIGHGKLAARAALRALGCLCLVACAACALACCLAPGASAAKLRDAGVAPASAASADSALSSELPGSSEHAACSCLQVAGNVDEKVLECDEDKIRAQKAPTDAGVPGSGIRADGTGRVGYGELLAEAAQAGTQACFWAGPGSQAADYALYIASGVRSMPCDDVRMVFGAAPPELADVLGRDDAAVYASVGEGPLPDGSVLYVRLNRFFSDGQFVNVFEWSAGSLAPVASGLELSGGYVSFPVSRCGAYVFVHASEQEAGALTSKRFFDGVQVGDDARVGDGARAGAATPAAAAAAVAGAAGVLVLAALALLAIRRRRARGTGERAGSGKRGGLS